MTHYIRVTKSDNENIAKKCFNVAFGGDGTFLPHTVHASWKIDLEEYDEVVGIIESASIGVYSVPFNVGDVTFYSIDSQGNRSYEDKVVSAFTVPGFVIQGIGSEFDGNVLGAVEIKYNVEISTDRGRDVEFIQYEGSRYPEAYTLDGETEEYSVSCAIVEVDRELGYLSNMNGASVYVHGGGFGGWRPRKCVLHDLSYKRNVGYYDVSFKLTRVGD